MSSLQGFYAVSDTRDTGNGTEVCVRILGDHPVYEGHFPGNPVAPGAALTQMVVDEADRLLGGGREFTGARQVKFLSVLNPHLVSELTLHYSFTERERQQHFSCVGRSGETIFFKINGAFD